MDDFAALKRGKDEPARMWGLRLLDDLSARHHRAARIPVENYLQRLPDLATEPEVILDLLVAEWTLRRQAGESVTLDEYVQRFPSWTEELSMLWAVDQQTPLPAAPAAAGLPGWYTGPTVLPAEFGGYRLLREFSGGGMARVFLAEPAAGGPAVALKVPRFPAGEDARSTASRRQRFLREARLTRRLDHPQLCRALDVGECDGLPYFTMPYYPRGSVGEEVQNGRPLPQRDAARLVAEVARALQHAHDLGIVHRDLKPSNLLRDEQGRVVVTDFGLAFPLEEEELRLTTTGHLLGTPMYLSPEQAAGKRDLTPASDIFSLGVVLYELVTGQRPFAGNLMELLRAIQQAEPAPVEKLNPAVSKTLAAICRKAMARDPGDRYPSMAALAGDLERFLSQPEDYEPMGDPTPNSVTFDLPLPPRRRRLRWAAGLAAGVVLLAGAFALRGALGERDVHADREDGGPPREAARPIVSTRQPLGLHGQLQRLKDDLAGLAADVRPHVRYFSLLAVHDNPYVSDADFGLHLDALRRVLNRLSRNKLKVPVVVDASGCLLRVELRDLDWEPGIEWPLVVRAEPYGVRYNAVNPDASLRGLAREVYELAGTDPVFETPYVRADWFVVAATRAPLYDQLQGTDAKKRSTPPFDLTGGNDPLARVVRLYQEDSLDARVAAAELGLGTVAELNARWPADKAELRKALDRGLPRGRWAGEDGRAFFAECIRVLKLGVPRARQ